ncbi:MAG: glycosyltransferase family 2 protein [Salinibacter sp.]
MTITNDSQLLKNGEDRPRVSVVIPIRNEEEYLPQCLNSILRNDYPHEYMEILVVDGMSTDGSRAIVESYMKRYPYIKLFDNPKIIQASAMNIGLLNAEGDIIIRMDAHTVYDSDYIRQCVYYLENTEAVNVGGAQRAVGTDFITEAIAITTTSPFGIGDARFRYSNQEEWVDTVYLGAWKKRDLEVIGGFNEDWAINEDYELNHRLRERIGQILLTPHIRSRYYVRSNIGSLARQYFRYGQWRVKTLVAYPESLRWRQLIPPVLTLALAVSLILLAIIPNIALVLPASYVLISLVASTYTAKSQGFRYIVVLPFLFMVVHLSWGIGFWSGLVAFGVPRLSWRTLLRAFRSPA